MRFEGGRRKKKQVLICNRDEFSSMGRLCTGSTICDRTGTPHLKWHPTTSGGKVVQFTTGDEREYPIGFVRHMRHVQVDSWASKGAFAECPA